MPAVVGLTLGNLVGNLASPFGAIDILGGTLANFMATSLAWRIGRIKFQGAWLTAATLETVTVTLVVGSYLSLLLSLPLWLGLAGVFIGSFIAINIAGYLLVRGVSRILPMGRAPSKQGEKVSHNSLALS